MKRIAGIVLIALLTLSSVAPLQAKTKLNAQERAAVKQAQKQQKAMQKQSKKQQKALKKQVKAQQKQFKKMQKKSANGTL